MKPSKFIRLSAAAATTDFPFLNIIRSRFHLRPCSSSAVAVDTSTTSCGDVANTVTSVHPWPEWVRFVEGLKRRGYLNNGNGSESEVGSNSNLYKDVNQLKDACLSFGRNRYDLFKSLSIDDIRTVVRGGCPNILRKNVNSAKRLRSFVQLDEEEVCNSCDLRGSCDRANVILKDDDGEARTVDIVRILLYQALDPRVLSRGEITPNRQLNYESSRKLLWDLVELSDTTPDPPVPDVSVPRKGYDRNSGNGKLSMDGERKRDHWICSKCSFMNFAKNIRCLECNERSPAMVDVTAMKPGDWLCSKCEFMNFAKNFRCRKCGEEAPKRNINVTRVIEMKKGDWNCGCGFMNFASNGKCLRCQQPRSMKVGYWECTSCYFLNFAKNEKCRKCGEEGPKEAINSIRNIERKIGDWNCGCGFMNFTANRKCLQCQQPRPIKVGDWECPSCYFVNFARNRVCLKCKVDRPKETTVDPEEQMWKNPH